MQGICYDLIDLSSPAVIKSRVEAHPIHEFDVHVSNEDSATVYCVTAKHTADMSNRRPSEAADDLWGNGPRDQPEGASFESAEEGGLRMSVMLPSSSQALPVELEAAGMQRPSLSKKLSHSEEQEGASYLGMSMMQYSMGPGRGRHSMPQSSSFKLLIGPPVLSASLT